MLAHTTEAKRFYKSKAWRECRQSYIASVFGLCERCKAPGTIVHHKKYIDIHNLNDPYVTLNHSNLELLCHVCHNKEHFEKYSPVREGLRFDDEGNLIEVGG
ncbi:HNH endonuclease [Lysinibacillus sphaericus]|uniref:HNH endonuclease n=1 Tax=Lysinibacillus sphaericus TaxID=1421 RepID=UPI003D06B54D